MAISVDGASTRLVRPGVESVDVIDAAIAHNAKRDRHLAAYGAANDPLEDEVSFRDRLFLRAS